jgi:type IV pilus assembly protein PilE
MKKIIGFTLIELLITVVIVAILVAISTVMYLSQVRAGRRVDAANTLSSMSLAEENYRTNNSSYGTLAQVWGGATTSTGGYYTLTITGVSATGYTLTATAVGDQANDTESGTSCATITLVMSSGTITKTPSACWPT